MNYIKLTRIGFGNEDEIIPINMASIMHYDKSDIIIGTELKYLDGAIIYVRETPKEIDKVILKLIL